MIEEVATVAEATALADGVEATGGHIQRAARSALRQRAPSLSVNAPRFTWDDIVLPADRLLVLRHLCSRVRYRSQVQQTWGLGRGIMPGVTALFAGLPGTGKSMAAEVIASDLGVDLCKIDLAQVVSKYIGETEKNLAKIFNEAEQCGVVLIFDEADALFGKRSDVKDSHDRYANIETSYLLQRMERYRGLAVLTTNLRANLDDAFTRRIGVAIDFPMPGAADRLRLWQRALAGAPLDEGLNLQELAERLEIGRRQHHQFCRGRCVLGGRRAGSDQQRPAAARHPVGTAEDGQIDEQRCAGGAVALNGRLSAQESISRSPLYIPALLTSGILIDRQ